jgi:molybdopterin molybdotransferase
LSSLLPVEDALRRLLRGAEPVSPETLPLAEANGRILSSDLIALRTQPPFAASAMDGYAVRSSEAQVGAALQVIGESRAGHRFPGRISAGQAVRIFTGAPVPDGSDAILIQENADADEHRVVVRESVERGRFIRRAGLDFTTGDRLIAQGRRMDSRALALAAAMGHATLSVRRRPKIAILANGDELVPPGASAGPDQIISSNGVGMSAFVQECGAEPSDLGIAPDREDEIAACIGRAAGADVLVVIGGASVGDHDLVRPALARQGLELDFWRIAMRPGKPLMVGDLDGMKVLGLPGNPVSALVCAHVFLRPLIDALLGAVPRSRLARATLSAPMPANDGRQDYIRARLEPERDIPVATPFERQDSSMLATLAAADALIIRAPHAPPAKAGDTVSIIPL